MGTGQNGITKRPQVFDGEGVDPTDFNALSSYSRAYVNDLVLGALMRQKQRGVGPAGIGGYPLLYSIGASGAPRNGATARSFGCNAGPLFFSPATPTIDGSTPKVLCYYLNTNEINGTLAVGDATNDRFDAVYVRISTVNGPNATRDFQDATGAVTSQSLAVTSQNYLEWTVVAGTPAAKPLIPAAPDTTWALWGVWWVPKTFGASVFSLQNIWDYRIPMESYRRHVLGVDAMAGFSGGSWSIFGASGYAQSGAAGGVTSALVAHNRNRSGRIMGFAMRYITANASSFLRPIVQNVQSGSVVAVEPSRTTGYPNNLTMPTGDMDNYTMSGGIWYNASGFSTSTSNSGYQLLPIWGNGYGSTAEDTASDGGSLQDSSLFCLYWCPAAAGDQIYSASFDIAG